MDLVVSKIAFSVFVSKGFFVIKYYPYVVSGYSGFFVMCYLFACSNMLWEIKDEKWVNFHFMYHVMLTSEQLIIVDSIRTAALLN